MHHTNFLMSKKRMSLKQGPKIQESIQGGPQGQSKNLTSPETYKLTKRTSLLEAKESGFTTKLAQEKRENTKALFSLLRKNSKFSNTNLFLSFHIAQISQREATLQTCLSSFLTGILSKPTIRSWTNKGGTQAIPKAASREVQIPQIMGQCISKCSMFSSYFPQRGHLLAREKPLFLSWSMVITQSQRASQAKKPTLEGTH